LTGGRNSKTITLPVKAEPCGAENIQVLAFSQLFGIMFVRMSNDIGYEGSAFQASIYSNKFT
jgi:hypothetical protein